MAGDWIKVEQATVDKPEVLRMAELLGWDRRQALGLLVEFWCWLDKNLSGSCPDFVRNMSRKSLDDVLHVPGFSACLEQIGWAKFDDECAVMTIINAERHNGNTAKTRALDAKRKKEKRQESVPKMSGSKPDKNGTREEKRREESIKSNATVPVSVPAWVPDDAWKSFGEMRVKIRAPLTDKAKTLAIAELGKLRDQGHDPRAVLEQSVFRGWRGLFPPKTEAKTEPVWAGAK